MVSDEQVQEAAFAAHRVEQPVARRSGDRPAAVRLATTAPDAPVRVPPDARPIHPSEFDAWMARLGPFETAPCLALAVSGGRDSMALALLAGVFLGSAVAVAPV